MPFDYQGAKAAGYSDEEINAYLAQKSGPASAPARNSPDWRIQALGTLPAIGATAGGALGFGAGSIPGSLVGAGLGGASGRILEQYGRKLMGAEPAQANVMGSPLPQGMDLPETALGYASGEASGLGAGGAVMGAGRAISRVPSNVRSAFGKLVARQAPGVGKAMDVAEFFSNLRGTPKAAAEEAAPAAKAVKTKPVRPKRVKKPEPKLGSAESRIKIAPAKPAPRAVAKRLPNTEPRARAQGPRPTEFALPQTHSLEDVLRASTWLEDEMTRRGLSEAEKAMMRQEARRLVTARP